jgi:hypothetical protein
MEPSLTIMFNDIIGTDLNMRTRDNQYIAFNVILEILKINIFIIFKTILRY